jgi:hypothetical protein
MAAFSGPGARFCGWTPAAAARSDDAMGMASRWRRWRRGWGALARHAAPRGYAQLGVIARLGLDLRVLAAAPRTAGFWRAAWLALAAGLIAQILCWRHDLHGIARDAVQVLPVALLAPWVAAARRRALARRLRGRNGVPAKAVTDAAAPPLHSAQRIPVERRPWSRRRTVRAARANPVAAGSTSRSPSAASRWWRRLRFRASRP